MQRWRGGIFVVVLGMASIACGLSAGDVPTPGALTPGGGGDGACDVRARQIEVNRLYREDMPAATGAYPSNCLYYCLPVREPGGSLTIEVRNASTDLDLFVGMGSMESVSGEQLVEGETYTWKSNQPGDADERVEVSPPPAGLYYLEVCSYEGESTPFELEARLR
jgi:hypothetical protein